VTPRARAAVAIAGLAGGAAITIALIATRGASRASGTALRSTASRLLFVTSHARTLTWADVTDLRGPAQDAIGAVAGWEQTSEQILGDQGNWNTRVVGTEPAYVDAMAVTMDHGAFFDDAAASAGAAQIVLGPTVVRYLFGSSDPVGATVRVRDRAFEVIGVLAAKGTSPQGMDRDDVAIVPARALERLHGGPLELHIDLTATDEDHLDDAEAQVDHLLRVRHHLAPGDPPDYQLRNLGKLLAARPELRAEAP
jgi:putative ABC transport system permease protein